MTDRPLLAALRDVAAQIGDEFGDRHAQDQGVFDDKHLLAVTGLGCIDLVPRRCSTGRRSCCSSGHRATLSVELRLTAFAERGGIVEKLLFVGFAHYMLLSAGKCSLRDAGGQYMANAAGYNQGFRFGPQFDSVGAVFGS